MQKEASRRSHFPNTGLPAAKRASYDLIALVASSGGLKALTQVLCALPPDFPAAVIVLQHLAPNYRSHMVEILKGSIALPVKQADSGELLRPGVVYIARPGKHLLVNLDSTLSLSDTAKVNFVRPSADVLFKSVAASFKSRAIAVVLTGRGRDGSLGVQAIKQHGGIVIAQDQATSKYFSMPGAAIATGKVDFIRPLTEIASTLVNLETIGATE